MDLLPESIEFSCSRQRNRVSIVRHFIVSTWPRCVINRRNQAGTRRWRAWVRERVRVDVGQTGKGRTKRTRRTRVSFWREKERARGEEERGVALRLVHARTPTSGTHVTRPDRYALPKLRSLFLSLSLSFSLSLSLSLSHPSTLYCSLFFPRVRCFSLRHSVFLRVLRSLPPAFPRSSPVPRLLRSFARSFPSATISRHWPQLHRRQLPSAWFQTREAVVSSDDISLVDKN